MRSWAVSDRSPVIQRLHGAAAASGPNSYILISADTVPNTPKASEYLIRAGVWGSPLAKLSPTVA